MTQVRINKAVEALLEEQQQIKERLRNNDYIGNTERLNDEARAKEVQKQLNKLYIEKNGL